MVCSWIPATTYFFLLVLLIVLLTYLLRRHVVGHVLHTNWVYALYLILGISILLVLIEYLVCGQVLWLTIFSIAAIIVVFIFDIILVMLSQHAKPAHVDVKELKSIVKSFKYKKKKKK